MRTCWWISPLSETGSSSCARASSLIPLPMARSSGGRLPGRPAGRALDQPEECATSLFPHDGGHDRAGASERDYPVIRRALRSKLLLAISLLMAMSIIPGRPASYQSGLSSVKTVFVILFENTNWASITPSVAPYIRTTVVPMGAHATRYFNPPGNHPSEPNYIWLEAGDNLGLTTNNDASASNSTSTGDHLVRYLQSAGISWKT